ncbi:hypothetical protein ACVDG8_033935 [Mesorhizobium sp. ORM8.1]
MKVLALLPAGRVFSGPHGRVRETIEWGIRRQQLRVGVASEQHPMAREGQELRHVLVIARIVWERWPENLVDIDAGHDLIGERARCVSYKPIERRWNRLLRMIPGNGRKDFGPLRRQLQPDCVGFRILPLHLEQRAKEHSAAAERSDDLDECRLHLGEQVDKFVAFGNCRRNIDRSELRKNFKHQVTNAVEMQVERS